jgi:hypothetical protein
MYLNFFYQLQQNTKTQARVGGYRAEPGKFDLSKVEFCISSNFDIFIHVNAMW